MCYFSGSLRKDDEYMTPKHAWEDIAQFIPRDGRVLWEPFYGDGASGAHLRELGFTVVHQPLEDFFACEHGDIVVSNPPFSLKRQVLERLVKLQKPFVLLMPAQTLHTLYIRSVEGLQIIVPRKRIQFGKEGKQTNKCNFDCLYFCWRMGLPRDITLL